MTISRELEKPGNFDEAFKLLAKWTKKPDEDDAKILFHIGWCIENGENQDKNMAVKYYLEAAENSNDSVLKMNCLFRVGWIYMHIPDNNTAINYYEKAITAGRKENIFNRIYQDATYWCGVCCETGGRYLDAIKLYENVRQYSHELYYESLFREIISQIAIGSFDKAFSLCEDFVSEDPKPHNAKRFRELKIKVLDEKTLLQVCLSEMI